MKKFISLFLVFSILLLSGNTFAKERKGAELIIQKIDGTQVRGELIAVKQNSLLLLERESGADMTVDVDDIIIISIVKKSQVFKGVATGFLIGGGVGAVIGVIGATTELSSIEENPTAGALFIGLFGVALGIIGAVIGGLFGAAAGKEKTIKFEGKSDSEIHEILEKLRKKARMRNFQ